MKGDPVNRSWNIAIQSAGSVRKALKEMGIGRSSQTTVDEDSDLNSEGNIDVPFANKFTTEISAAYDMNFKNAFSTLYKRGINISRPEILATSEFIPISDKDLDSIDNSYTSNLSVGEEKTIQIRQIFRLLELHRNIKSANIALINEIIDKILIKQGYELSLKTLYGVLEDRYEDDIISLNNFNNIDEAVNYFIEYMSDEADGGWTDAYDVNWDDPAGNILDFNLLKNESIKQKPSYRLVYQMFFYRKAIEGVINYILSVSAIKKAFRNHIDLRIDGGRFGNEVTQTSTNIDSDKFSSGDGSRFSSIESDSDRMISETKRLKIKKLHKLIAGSTQYGHFSNDNKMFGDTFDSITPNDMIQNTSDSSNSQLRSVSNFYSNINNIPPMRGGQFQDWFEGNNNVSSNSIFPYFETPGFVTSLNRTKIACQTKEIDENILNTQLLMQIFKNIFNTCNLYVGIPSGGDGIKIDTIYEDVLNSSLTNYYNVIKGLKNIDFDCLYGGRANPYVNPHGVNSQVGSSVFLRSNAKNNRSTFLTDDAFVGEIFPDAKKRAEDDIVTRDYLKKIFNGDDIGTSNIFGTDELPLQLANLIDNIGINDKSLDSLAGLYVGTLFDLCGSINMYNLSLGNNFKSINIDSSNSANQYNAMSFDEFSKEVFGNLINNIQVDADWYQVSLEKFGDLIPELSDYKKLKNKLSRTETAGNESIEYMPSEVITNSRMIEKDVLSAPHAFPFLAKEILDTGSMGSLSSYANQMLSIVNDLGLDITAIFGLDQGSEYGYVPGENNINYCTMNRTIISPVHIIEKTFEMIKEDLESILAGFDQNPNCIIPLLMSIASANNEDIARNLTEAITIAEYTRGELNLTTGYNLYSDYYDNINDIGPSTSTSVKEHWEDSSWAGLFAIPMTSDVFHYFFDSFSNINQIRNVVPYDTFDNVYYELFGSTLQGRVNSTFWDGYDSVYDFLVDNLPASDSVQDTLSSWQYNGSQSIEGVWSQMNAQSILGMGLERAYTIDNRGYAESWISPSLGTIFDIQYIEYGKNFGVNYDNFQVQEELNRQMNTQPTNSDESNSWDMGVDYVSGEYMTCQLKTNYLYDLQAQLGSQFTYWIGETSPEGHNGINTPAKNGIRGIEEACKVYTHYNDYIKSKITKPIARHQGEANILEHRVGDPYDLPALSAGASYGEQVVRSVFEENIINGQFEASGLYQLIGENRYKAEFGPLKLNKIARSLVSTQLFNVFLGSCLNFKASIDSSLSAKMKLTIMKSNIEGVVMALNNEPVPSLDGDNSNFLHFASYKTTKACMNTIRNYYLKHRQNIFDKFVPLIAHFNSIKRMANYTESFFNINKASGKTPKTMFGFKCLKNTLEEQNSGVSYNEMASDMIVLANNQYAASSYKSYLNFFAPSKDYEFFSNSNYVNNKQLKLMAKSLSSAGFGFLGNEKSGNKTAFHVGIPTNFIESSSQKAYIKTRDSSYLDSSKVCLYLFKYHDLPNSVLYYPKGFVFDANSFVVENSRIAENSNHIHNYDENWSFDSIMGNFEMYRLSPAGVLESSVGWSSIDDNNEYSWLSSPTRNKIKKEELRNHIIDHYLKMYYRLSCNLNFDEYIFKLHKSTRYSPFTSLSSLEKTVYENEFLNDMMLRFPSGNVNKELKNHFNRLFKTAKLTSYLSGKNKLLSSSSPNAFDRVFSLFINEDDFVAYPVNPFNSLDEFYSTCPTFSLDSSLQIISGPTANIETSIDTLNLGNSYKNHFMNISGEETMTESNYFCVVSILRK